MEKPKYEELVDAIVTRDPRFHRDAYEFLREALEFAQLSRHVTAESEQNQQRDRDQEHQPPGNCHECLTVSIRR